MNNQISEGKWKEIKGEIRKNWGEISLDELEKTRGNLDKIAGKIQKKYGESIDEVRKKINSLLGHVNNNLS